MATTLGAVITSLPTIQRNACNATNAEYVENAKKERTSDLSLRFRLRASLTSAACVKTYAMALFALHNKKPSCR